MLREVFMALAEKADLMAADVRVPCQVYGEIFGIYAARGVRPILAVVRGGFRAMLSRVQRDRLHGLV